jgi:hypothetical protein
VRFVRTSAETVGAWVAFAGELPALIRIGAIVGIVLAIAGAWRLFRGSR